MSLSGKQKKALLLLIFEKRGKIARSELQKSAGIEKKELEELETASYVSKEPVGKSKRAFRVSAADRAWTEAPGFLGESEIFPRSKAPLGSVLEFLAGYLEKTGCNLAEFTNPPDKAPEAPRPSTAPAPDAEGAIRGAYLTLTGRQFREHVPLRELRPLLHQFSREDLDERLQSLQLDRKLLLMMDENPQTITAADQEAAVRVGGVDKHFVVIEA